MDSDNLVISFENSFCNEVADFTGEIVEFGVDLDLDNEVLKDVPFVGTAFKLYSIGSVRNLRRVYDRYKCADNFGKHNNSCKTAKNIGVIIAYFHGI